MFLDFSKKLYKSKTDVKISGVLGGVAEYLGVDSTWIRIIYILLCFISFGSALIVYLLLAFVIPDPVKEKSNIVDTDYKEK